VVSVELRGTHDGEWTQACEAHSIEAPYRPPLTTPKPKTNGVESATVVGPRGEEIHCDEFGRVRVHFHWDRQSNMDEKSSCWIPVSQAWGGAGYGLMNVPRVGQEVIVDFQGGDPDRPVIVGRVHTATQPVPQRLPENKTQSGWITQSSPNGGGQNVLLFEDRKGEELIRIEAERDLVKLVKRDETVDIKGKSVVNIEQGEQRFTGLDREAMVVKSCRTLIGLNASRTVGVNDVLMVGGDQRVSVEGAASSEVGTTYTLRATDKIVLQCGASTITADSAGTITLQGAKLVLESSGPVNISGTEVSISASGAIDIAGSAVALSGDTVDTN
jgi:type VI secretion system secreted protein VgrG